jgi:hypothetical protein
MAKPSPSTAPSTVQRCKTSLQHHYVFADESISMDLEHIALPRESQMGIPHISSVEVEYNLQTMRKHGFYQQTVNAITY